MQILNPSLVGQKIEVEPIEKTSGCHPYFAVRYELFNPPLNSPLALKRDTSNLHTLLALPLPPLTIRLQSYPLLSQESLNSPLHHARKLRARPRRLAQQRAHNRSWEPPMYPNDDDPLRRVQLADIGVGEHLARAGEVGAHVAGRNEWVWREIEIPHMAGRVGARTGGTGGARERRVDRAG